MFVQAVAIGLLALGDDFGAWAGAALLLGVGTAMVYPTLLATIGDVAHPGWRASAVGVYRFWRDLGFAAGALLSGWVADLAGFEVAIWTVAGVTALSAVIVVVRMYETHPRRH
jgi:MFS family permease